MESLEDCSDIEQQKKALISEINDEIQREHSSLNTFTSEKFSVILLILGIIGLGFTIWQTLRPNIDLTEFLTLWISSTFILVLFWMYKIYETINTLIKKKPDQTKTMTFIQHKFQEIFNKNEFQNAVTVNDTSDSKDREHVSKFYSRVSNYLCTNIDYVAKNLETRMRPLSLLFVFLLFIEIVNYEHFLGVTIPSQQQSIPFLELPLYCLIILYALIFIIFGFWWRFLFICGHILLIPIKFGFNSVSHVKARYGRKIISYCVLILILVYAALFLLFGIFLLGLPFYILIQSIVYYSMNTIQLALIKFCLVFILTYVLFRSFEILFSVHLVERIKNDKIAWLNVIKYDLLSHSEPDELYLNEIKEKIKVADLYSQIPYTSLAAFTRYEIIPVYRYDVELKILQKRIDFLNNN